MAVPRSHVERERSEISGLIDTPIQRTEQIKSSSVAPHPPPAASVLSSEDRKVGCGKAGCRFSLPPSRPRGTMSQEGRCHRNGEDHNSTGSTDRQTAQRLPHSCTVVGLAHRSPLPSFHLQVYSVHKSISSHTMTQIKRPEHNTATMCPELDG